MNRPAITKIKRNIFELYKKPEDQVTHALAHAVASNERLTEDFVEFLLGHSSPRGCTIEIQTTSKKPKQIKKNVHSENDSETRPDLWIRSKNDEEFACVIENKVTDKLKTKQLSNHAKRAQKYFSNITVVAITQDDKEPTAIQKTSQQNDKVKVIWQKWTAVYNFLMSWERKNRDKNDTWLVQQFCEFLQLTEECLIKEGNMIKLTEFSGIPFSNEEPYNYDIAKNLLRKLMPHLRDSKELRQAYPHLDAKSMHQKIMGRDNNVWDFLKLELGEGDHTNYPHISVIIGDNSIKLQLTIPKSASAKYWMILKKTNKDDWQDIFQQIVNNLSQLTVSSHQHSPQAYVEILQRHYPGRSLDPFIDGELVFSLDSVTETPYNSKVKTVPVWVDSLCSLISSKSKANIQLGIGIQYHYREYPESSSIIRTEGFKGEAVKAICALKPFHDLLYGNQD